MFLIYCKYIMQGYSQSQLKNSTNPCVCWVQGSSLELCQEDNKTFKWNITVSSFLNHAMAGTHRPDFSEILLWREQKDSQQEIPAVTVTAKSAEAEQLRECLTSGLKPWSNALHRAVQLYSPCPANNSGSLDRHHQRKREVSDRFCPFTGCFPRS